MVGQWRVGKKAEYFELVAACLFFFNSLEKKVRPIDNSIGEQWRRAQTPRKNRKATTTNAQFPCLPFPEISAVRQRGAQAAVRADAADAGIRAVFQDHPEGGVGPPLL
jgi:hypothetical protein